jgi:predicted transcriptional regulator
VSLSHYQKIDRGDLDVRLSTAKKLAECFEVSELLRGL